MSEARVEGGPHGGEWTSGGGESRSTAEEFRAARATANAKIASAPRPTEADVARNTAMIARSSRAGGELRGNSRDRFVRTQKLLNEFGDGEHCPCVYCGHRLDASTLTQDKIYTAREGGRYRMDNLLPACLPCNQGRSDTSLAGVTLAS
jgi:5-methylcytosine-specific restriction endonuclease McrA